MISLLYYMLDDFEAILRDLVLVINSKVEGYIVQKDSNLPRHIAVTNNALLYPKSTKG